MIRRRFLLALAISLVFHLALLVGPRWRLAMEGDEPVSGIRLEARLMAPAPALVDKAPPATKPRAAPRPKPRQHTPAAPGVAQAEVRRGEQPVQPVLPLVEAPAGAGKGKDKDGEADAAAGREDKPAATAPPPSLAAGPFSEMLASASHGTITFRVMLGRQGLIVGRMVHTWSRDGERYVLEGVTETVGLVALFKRFQMVQRSEGRMSNAGLVPEVFRSTQDDGGPPDHYLTRFDWQAMRVKIEKPGEQKEVPLDPGAQDLLSFIYQLVLHPPVGRSGLHIATGKSYNGYALEFRGEEPVPTPVGDVNARHYATVGPPGEQVTELWLAPELGYLPVKVRVIDKKGNVVDGLIQSVDFGGVVKKEIERNPLGAQ